MGASPRATGAWRRSSGRRWRRSALRSPKLRARQVIGDDAFHVVEEEIDLLELTADARVRPSPEGERALGQRRGDPRRSRCQTPGARHPRHPGGVLAAMTTARGDGARPPGRPGGRTVAGFAACCSGRTSPRGPSPDSSSAFSRLTGAALVLERPVLSLHPGHGGCLGTVGSRGRAALERPRGPTRQSLPRQSRWTGSAAPPGLRSDVPGGVSLDRHTGELQETATPAVRAAFQKVEELHRWLLLSGDGREIGQRIVGASTLLFLFLGLTGPFLWMPRRWTGWTVRRVAWFRRGLRGRARDSELAPRARPLVPPGPPRALRIRRGDVLPLGERCPVPHGRQRPAASRPSAGAALQQPVGGAAPLPLQRLADAAMERVPTWRELTVRLDRRPAGLGRCS